MPVVDLRRRLELTEGVGDEQTRIIVAQSTRGLFGMVVDVVNEVLRIHDDEIEPPPQGVVGAHQAYIRGLVRRGDKVMILLDVEPIVSDAAMAAVSLTNEALSH